ncbi:hypothetical protein [Arcobacter sp.]|uniref:hypothetical protein n=1 Tax=Arcobacter sp. TaxID=1872629 RepID=UPI003D13176D
MTKVALVILFNHHYPKNIEKLENIYNSRFKDIYYLVPFYKGNKKNVIAVYDNSYYFNGFIAQGYKFFQKDKYIHYLFLQDDVLLNYDINENNYMEYFNLDEKSSYMRDLGTICSLEYTTPWPFYQEALEWRIKQPGLEIENFLPSYNDAVERFKLNGLKITNLKNKEGKEVKQYPFAGGLADISIVSSQDIENFVYYCGIFSATKLFVEIALPTALILSSKNIKNNSRKGTAYVLWNEDRNKLFEACDGKISNLKNLMAKNNYLFTHPVKLSKWLLD